MYKVSMLLALSMLFAIMASAQYGCKTITRGDTIYLRCYYTSGQLSTEISYLKGNDRWKNLKVYSKDKAVTYERSYGQRHGSSGVELTYQSNGAVASAHYTMQPDGGIQYTDIRSFFTSDGRIEREEDNSRGNDGELHLRLVQTPHEPGPTMPTTKVIPIAPKPSECTPVPSQKELYLINYTSEQLHLTCRYLDIQAVAMAVDIDPSDTAKVGVYSSFHSSVQPLGHYSIQVTTKAKAGYLYQIKQLESGDSPRQYVIVVCKKIKIKK